MKKALFVYFSQSGQAKEIADAVTGPLKREFDLTIEELKPTPPYPFPWTGMSFFQTFPESVQGIPCELEPFNFNTDDNYDLIILACQVWYLSPSVPISSFLQSEPGKRVIKNKPVVTIQGVRNMWVMSQERIKKLIKEAGGNLIGNIVLTDNNPNLISVITIVKWMSTGEKRGTGLYARLFPPAGVQDQDIRATVKYGEIILNAFRNGGLKDLQNDLISAGAVRINPVLAAVEKRGRMMFGIWSKFILKKGNYNSPGRVVRLKLFKYYLFAVIYLISPIVSLLLLIIQKISPAKTRKMISYYAHNDFAE